MPGPLKGVVGEGKSVSWGGAQSKGEVNKRKIIKNMFFHSDLLTSLTSSLTQLCLMIRKLALRSDGVKRWKDINQPNHNIHKFDLHQTLPKYLRIFLNKFEVLVILANGPIILEY